MIDPRIKKGVIISSAILSVAIVIVGGMVIYQNSDWIQGISLFNNAEDGEISADDAPRKAQKVFDQSIISATSTGGTLYFYSQNGQLKSYNRETEEIEILHEEQKNIQSVDWSFGGNMSGIETSQGFQTVNHETLQVTSFSEQVLDLKFLPNDRVVYLFDLQDGSTDISTADANEDNFRQVINLQSPEGQINATSTPKWISQILPPQSSQSSEIFMINTQTGEALSNSQARFGLDITWSPYHDVGVVSFVSEKGGANLNLALVNTEGFIIQEFPEVNTLVDKVAFSRDKNVLYYIEPVFANTDKLSLPEDYHNQSVDIKREQLYALDIETGERTLISSDLGDNIEAEEIFLDEEERTLYFRNRTDNHLYSVDFDQEI